MDEETREAMHGLELQLVSLKTAFESHALYTQKALEKAESSISRRLDGMNEFRDQLKDQTKTFLTWDAYEAKHGALETKIESIQKIVYIGVGIWILAQIIISLVPKFI